MLEPRPRGVASKWIDTHALYRAIGATVVPLPGQLTLIPRTRPERHALAAVTLARLLTLARGVRVELAPAPARAGGRS